jgi:type II secretory pathway component PulJ
MTKQTKIQIALLSVLTIFAAVVTTVITVDNLHMQQKREEARMKIAMANIEDAIKDFNRTLEREVKKEELIEVKEEPIEVKVQPQVQPQPQVQASHTTTGRRGCRWETGHMGSRVQYCGRLDLPAPKTARNGHLRISYHSNFQGLSGLRGSASPSIVD